MGISVEQWRVKIGTFCQPNKCKTKLKTLELRYVSLCIRVILFYLLVAEGIETNAGPPWRPTGRGSRGNRSNRGEACGFGPPSGRGSRWASQRDYFANDGTDGIMDHRVYGPLRSEHLISQSSAGQQSSNSWLINAQPQSQMVSNELTRNDTSDNESDNTLFDDVNNYDNSGSDASTSGNIPQGGNNMTDLLLEIRRDVKQMNKKFDGMERTVKDLKKDNQHLKQQNERLSKQVYELSNSVTKLEARAKESEKKNEQLETQSRRDNLKFYGIEEDPKETWEQTETKLRTYLSDELQIDESSIKIERAHRLSSKASPRPIIAKFSFFKDKESILKTDRQKRKDRLNTETTETTGNTDNVDGNEHSTIRNKPIRVSEDFPERVKNARMKLYPFLRSCHEKGTQAFLRYDTLVVDGQPYVYDYDSGRPVPQNK